jgi:hemolysin activation/secretion protein
MPTEFLTLKQSQAMLYPTKFSLILISLISSTLPALAQVPIPNIPPQTIPRPQLPAPTPTPIIPLPIPAPELNQPVTPPPDESGELSDNVFVDRFEVIGSTVFSTKELDAILKPFTGRPIAFIELLQARTAITQLYQQKGYITSVAILPPQAAEKGVFRIQVLEGSIEQINVTGNRRLNPGYVKSRLGLVAQTPVNVNKLLEGLRLLQVDPQLANISADLQAGTKPASNRLQINIKEAKTQQVAITLDNSRSPSVGSFRRQLELSQANLLGFGDRLQVGYSNTSGSNGFDINYTLPISPRNTTLRFAYGRNQSTVIEAPFDPLDIRANSRYYEMTLRQPISQRTSGEFAIGLTLSHQSNQTELGIDNIGPFPLSEGSDAQGRTKVSALRFFQEWVSRSDRQVLALRSQFSAGLGLFNATQINATQNASGPDSKFFTWRGQTQLTRLLAPETLLLVKGELQLADRRLLAFEQLGLGGQGTVRGYRQDTLLANSGAAFSTELRLPILRNRRNQANLFLTPFVDLAWAATAKESKTNFIASTGVGLLWQKGDLAARLDFGLPLVSAANEKRSLQEKGLHFSLTYSPSF